jgi:hypothetical protein
MSHSWRIYDDAIDDPKLMGLTDQQFRRWFNLRCLCSVHGGELPPVAIVANKLRIALDEAKRTVAEFAALGLVELAADGSATMRSLHQPRSDLSTPRVRRFRKRQQGVSSTVSEVAPNAETSATRTPTRPPNDRVPNTRKIDYDPTEHGEMDFADPSVRVRRVRVTNGLDVPFADRFDSVLVTIAPGGSESISVDMAAHFFGPTFDRLSMFRHVSKRQGWNTPGYLKVNPETGKTLAEENFGKLKITPVIYKMIEDEPDPKRKPL